jgi:hypothetical protein
MVRVQGSACGEPCCFHSVSSPSFLFFLVFFVLLSSTFTGNGKNSHGDILKEQKRGGTHVPSSRRQRLPLESAP